MAITEAQAARLLQRLSERKTALEVTLPSITVGAVGGGTSVPTHAACRNILGMAGAGHAQAPAEVRGALTLAGEISLTAAICANEFARAQERLARGCKSGSARRG